MYRVMVCLTDYNRKYTRYVSAPRELVGKLKSVAMEHDVEPEEIDDVPLDSEEEIVEYFSRNCSEYPKEDENGS